jgi:hypothetical protein
MKYLLLQEPHASCPKRRPILSICSLLNKFLFPRNVIQLPVTAKAFSISLIRFTLKMEATRPVLTRVTRRHIPEDEIPHNHRREYLKCYISLTV